MNWDEYVKRKGLKGAKVVEDATAGAGPTATRTIKQVSEAQKAGSGFNLRGSDALALASTGAQLLGVGQDGSELGGATSGALSGAQLGMKFGPTGAIVGGVVGGAMGALGARSERKAAAAAAKARAEAQHASNLGRIEQEKDAKIQGAFSRLSQAFASNLRRKKKVTL